MRKPQITTSPRSLQNDTEAIRKLVDRLCIESDGANVPDLITLLMAVGNPSTRNAEGNLLVAITHALSYSDIVRDNVDRLFSNPPNLRAVK